MTADYPYQDYCPVCVQLAQVLVDMKRFQDFQDVAVAALVCPQFMNEQDKATVSTGYNNLTHDHLAS